MRTSNESIIAVPTIVEEPGQTRQFLVRLVEQLDVILGVRGGDPYVPESQFVEDSLAGLTALEQTILEVIRKLLAAGDELTEELLANMLEAIDALKSPVAITNADTSVQAVTGPPTKAEVEAIDAKVVANAQAFNDLLTALRDTEIIGI